MLQPSLAPSTDDSPDAAALEAGQPMPLALREARAWGPGAAWALAHLEESRRILQRLGASASEVDELVATIDETKVYTTEAALLALIEQVAAIREVLTELVEVTKGR